MDSIKSQVWINAPLEKVYAIAKNNEAFPNFMPEIESITVIEKNEMKVVCDWVGIITYFGLKVKWTQEDIWDNQTHTCHFRQIKGDYDHMDGSWTFSEDKGGTLFEGIINYQYDIPFFGPLLKKVVHSIITKNIDQVLICIKERAENAS